MKKTVSFKHNNSIVKAFVNRYGKVELQFFRDEEEFSPGYTKKEYDEIREEAQEQLESDCEE